MKPLVSVNLLLFQPQKYLEPCLKAIFAQSYDNFELLVMDNNSGDGTLERAEAIIKEAQNAGLKVPFYKIIANKENLGFAGGHNLALRESQGEIVVMVNQDVILDEDFLSQSVNSFNDKKVSSVQAKILRLKTEDEKLIKTDIIDTTGLVILKNRRIIARGQGRQDQGQFDRAEEVFGVDGALPVYRRAALEDAKIKIGSKEEYLDEDFFMYKEDVDLAWRLKLFGWQALYEPKAVAWHARTAGDSAKTGYLGIIKERLKINKFGKYHSFKNQRLMQIKNEEFCLLWRHFFYFAPKEIASWFYVLLFEHYTWKSIKELISLAPRAWQKRRLIMERKKTSTEEMKKWFK
jgi:GT2 family glycosyltransferase